MRSRPGPETPESCRVFFGQISADCVIALLPDFLYLGFWIRIRCNPKSVIALKSQTAPTFGRRDPSLHSCIYIGESGSRMKEPGSKILNVYIMPSYCFAHSKRHIGTRDFIDRVVNTIPAFMRLRGSPLQNAARTEHRAQCRL